MKLTIRLFAMLREALQTDALSIEVPEGTTVADLRTRLAASHPELSAPLAGSRVAAALRFVPESYVLTGTEELAIVPPVSGG